MKTLTAIILVQFVAILFLYVKLVEIGEDLSAQSVAPTISSGNDTAEARLQLDASDGSPNLTEDRLRVVIREELSAYLAAQAQPNNADRQTIVPGSVDPVELDYRKEQVSQQLDYYTTVGSISDLDMQKLQMDIAKLDDASRKEMLRKLTRALNSGQLDGRF